MLIKTAQRIEADAATILKTFNNGDVTLDELRQVLGVVRKARAKLDAFQRVAAITLSRHEQHGDGGIGLLQRSAGLSRRDAKRQIQTVEVLDEMPKVRDAVEDGRVSFVNAERLADASKRVGTKLVETDLELLSKAESMLPESFAKETRRWAAEREADGGKSEYQRARAKRSVRIWDGDDGLVHLKGEFDKITGRRISRRLRATAEQLYKADKKNAVTASKDTGSSHRTFNQCMADALDDITKTRFIGLTPNIADLNGTSNTNTVAEMIQKGTNPNIADLNETNNTSLDTAATSTSRPWTPTDLNGTNNTSLDSTTRTTNSHTISADTTTNGSVGSNLDVCKCGGPAMQPYADIAIVVHIDKHTGKLVAQLADGEPLPAEVLDELMCNSAVTGMLFEDVRGVVLWQGRSKRTATAAQLRTLEAMYGGCFACGAIPQMCQAHHITPWAEGGKTDVSNMVLVCWNCHQKIHHHNWRIITQNGQQILTPPKHNPPKLEQHTSKSQNGQQIHNPPKLEQHTSANL